MSKEEAARYLGVAPRQVYRMVKDGLIFPTGGRFRTDEVCILRELREDNLSLVSVAAMARQASIRAARAEKVASLILSTAGADILPAPLDKDSVVATHMKIEHEMLHNLEKTASEISEWTRLLFSLGEEYFEAVSLHLQLKDPWSLYISFATKLISEMPHAKVEIDPVLRVAYSLLAAARRSLRQAAYLYAYKHYGRVFAHRAFPDPLNDTHEKILAYAIM